MFSLIHTDTKSSARAGTIETGHSIFETPVFMPVGTLGTVKGIHQHELAKDLNAQIILGNTYHLYLRPGVDTIYQAGGLHKFMGWQNSILTDSGGYQVFSLSNQRKIYEDGVMFQSHIDGSKHLFTPEKVIDIQRKIGADIIMAFDECPPITALKSYVKKSLDITEKWLLRCKSQFEETKSLYGYTQTIFPVIQGGIFEDLRKKSAQFVASLDFEGYAIGGLSVGEPKDIMYKMIDIVNPFLPENKPRYLMGVGTPENLLEAIERGIDMFDCVLPTRNGRHGLLYTSEGIVNIKNKKWMHDFSALDTIETNEFYNNYSKAYVRHLIISKESLGAQICSFHNLLFYSWLLRTARIQILNNNFVNWKKEMMPRITKRL